MTRVQPARDASLNSHALTPAALLQVYAELRNEPPPPCTLLAIRGVKTYYGSIVALRGVDLDVHRGEIVTMIGANGAGKSTTIKMLTTLLTPTSGTLFIDGKDVKKNPREVRRSFGIVFQDPSLDDELTAYENMEIHAVLYGVKKEVRRERIQQLLEFVELWDRRKSLVKEFSGGMKRRLEIARGLLHHPKVLFLDEPTLGLDPQTRNHMWQYLSKLNKDEGITVFFTTHYMEEAERIADHIAIIDHGNIIANGTVEELKTQTGTGSLEEAFLKLTGRDIREEEVSKTDAMRMRHNAWSKK